MVGTVECPSIELGLPPTTFSILPMSLKRGAPLRLVTVLFNQGINPPQTLSNMMGTHGLQDDINEEGLYV
jgi:hypothetical protein